MCACVCEREQGSLVSGQDSLIRIINPAMCPFFYAWTTSFCPSGTYKRARFFTPFPSEAGNWRRNYAVPFWEKPKPNPQAWNWNRVARKRLPSPSLLWYGTELLWIDDDGGMYVEHPGN